MSKEYNADAKKYSGEVKDADGCLVVVATEGSKAEKFINSRIEQMPEAEGQQMKERQLEKRKLLEKQQEQQVPSVNPLLRHFPFLEDFPADHKKQEKKMEKFKNISWQYDGGAMGTVLKSKSGFSNCSLLENETDLDNYKKKLEKQGVRVKKKIKNALPIGVEVFTEYYYQRLWREISILDFEKFKAMTQEALSDKDRLPIVKLIAVILSSYIIRPLLNEVDDIIKDFRLDEKNLRAVHIVFSKSENAFYGLKQICESMIVSTVADDDLLKLCTPVVISPKPNQSILKLAYLQVRRCKEKPLPAPYRDTSILLDCRTVNNKELTQLSALNPWCSLVLFGKQNLPINILGFSENFDGKTFTSLSSNWNPQDVLCLVQAYVATVPSLFDKESPKILDIWQQSGRYFTHYADAVRASEKKKISDAERFKLRVEVTALLSFLQFVHKQCSVPDDTMEAFKTSLLEILLPGCVPAPKTELVTETEIEVKPEQTPQEIFEELLQKVLIQENLIHFYPIEDKNGAKHLDKLEDGTDIWGYIKYFDWDENKKVPCLIIFIEKLNILNAELGLCYPNFADVLRKVRTLGLKYVHKSKNYAYTPQNDTKRTQPAAFRLKISELPISEDIQQALLAKYIRRTEGTMCTEERGQCIEEKDTSSLKG